MITQITVDVSAIGDKRGFSYSVFYDNRPYPNIRSGLYTTVVKALQALVEYVNHGKIEFYGDAE